MFKKYYKRVIAFLIPVPFYTILFKITLRIVDKYIKIIPVEVKSSRNYTTTSLNKFSDIYKKRIENSYIIHPKKFSIREDGVICIPAYMTFCLF